MTALLNDRSKITAKGQTTVPKAIRMALGVSYGGEIAYVVDERGVSLRRIEVEDADPVIDGFLSFLASDMACNPQTIAAIPASLAQHMATLTTGIEVDLDETIEGPVTL